MGVMYGNNQMRMFLSPPVLARTDPTTVRRDTLSPSCAITIRLSMTPDAPFHVMIDPSYEALIASPRSCETTTAATGYECPLNVATICPLATSMDFKL